MRLLVLGGGAFVGRAVVAGALTRGWSVTTFTRGRTTIPPAVESLTGDRRVPEDLRVLAERDWDAVVDTWSAEPRAVRETARLLADRAGHYGYVSSRSVYQPPWGPTEDAAVVEADADAGPPTDGEPDYAADKRGAELAALREFGPDRVLLARAGLILGPWEDIGRLPWWLLRLHNAHPGDRAGGRVLAPGPPDLPLQYVDVRDLAGWLLDAAERRLAGTFNAVSAPGHATMGRLLEACRAVTESQAELVWVPPERVLAAGIKPWTELPIWAPPDPAWAWVYGGDVRRALAAGLRCRPVEETVADTWRWLEELDLRPPQRPDRPPVGLDLEREAPLLPTPG